MTHPDNQPDDDDGGTFKLKPSGASKSEPPQGENLDSTMKLRKVGGGAPGMSAPPPPPPSPLGNPTGPANPPGLPPQETSVMPQQGGSQTGFQPSAPMPGQSNPLGAPTPPPGYQQQYGQQPPPGQMPQQQYGHPGAPNAQAGTAGQVPSGVKRIGLMALIAGGLSLVNVVVNMAFAGAETGMFSVPSLLFALAVLGYGFALPRGMLSSKGLRMTGIILMMIQGGFGLLGLLGLLGIAGLIGAGVLLMSLLFGLVIVGADAWATFIYFKDHEAHAWIKGAPAAPHQTGGGAMPPPGQYGQQHPGQPGQPGGYPPPPGYQQPGGQGPQQPYGR